ncbi:MAG: hypothetical protein M1319_00280 [Chloroflexi bacterium]|nr:hypothetical protein [Chloroflexota bacterium]
MDLALGTEPAKQYYAFELMAAAQKLVRDVMLAKQCMYRYSCGIIIALNGRIPGIEE